jgi:hypothetical protein
MTEWEAFGLCLIAVYVGYCLGRFHQWRIDLLKT